MTLQQSKSHGDQLDDAGNIHDSTNNKGLHDEKIRHEHERAGRQNQLQKTMESEDVIVEQLVPRYHEMCSGNKYECEDCDGRCPMK